MVSLFVADANMSFSKIPPEIAWNIAMYLTASDMFTLLLASRKAHYLFIKSLYCLAKEHKTGRVSELTQGLQEVTFWYDKTGIDSVIEWAAIHNRLYTFQQLLLEPHMDLLQADTYGVTLLHRLSAQGLVLYMEPLIMRLKLTDINPFQPDCSKLTPLHYAAGRGMTDAVELLLAMGADVAAKDNHGNTALHLAAVTGSLQVFSHLVHAGADVASESRFGWIPVDQAGITNHQKAVIELERLGSRPPNWQHKGDALNEFVRLSPCPQECYLYHAVF